ncbi:Transcription initiation factor IIF subunit beta [Dictyocoela muelleri]|nr:Transcription initiation factor IIF subunit beta [Dictyocoela muelleri]
MALNIEHSNVKIWLVKFPKYLTEHIWQFDDLEMGEVKIIRGTLNKPELIRFSIKNMPEIPQEYELISLNNNVKYLYVLNGDIIEGKIDNNWCVTPILNNEYFKYQNSRTNKEKRKIEVIHFRDGSKTTLGDITLNYRKRRQTIAANRRERSDRDYVVNLIFEAFEKYELWSVIELSDFTKQPVAYIRELIDEICISYKLEYKSLYELKPEYKNVNNKK